MSIIKGIEHEPNEVFESEVLIKSVGVHIGNLHQHVTGGDLIKEMMYRHPLDNQPYQLECYLDREEGKIKLRITRKGELIVPDSRIKRAAAKLLEDHKNSLENNPEAGK